MSSFLANMFHNWPIKVSSFVAAITVYLFYQLAIQVEENFIVDISLTAPPGMILLSPQKASATVTLVGHKDDIGNFSSEDFNLYANLENAKEGTSRQVIEQLGAPDWEANNIEFSISPSSIDISLEQQVERLIPIEVPVSGYPSNGFLFAKYEVEPIEVRVVGAKSIINKTEKIRTSTVDLSGRDESFSIELSLEKESANISFLDFSSVTARITINPQSGISTITVPLQVSGLASSLELVEVIPNTIELTLQGSQFIIDNIIEEPSLLLANLNAANIVAQGRYYTPITIDSPDGISVFNNINSATIVVRRASN